MSMGLERIVIFCAVSAGVDTAMELVRRGVRPAALVGLCPDAADPDEISGWIDLGEIGRRCGVPVRLVKSYGLRHPDDRAAIEALRPDLVLVTGWQRLLPEWLIDLPRFGAVGGHGSPDGIHGGRGRSPQTWALLLGCRSFDLSLFRITPGVDAGPVLASRTFSYSSDDDICTSYYRASLATADMVMDLLANPERLARGSPQPADGFYYPQRRPEDGHADWTLSASEIAAHCRALTRPYPGLWSGPAAPGVLRIWQCQPFDGDVSESPGTIGPCFTNGEFLVYCLDGRLLVRDWSATDGWAPRPGEKFASVAWSEQLRRIIQRHEKKYPQFPIAPRIRRRVEAIQSPGVQA